MKHKPPLLALAGLGLTASLHAQEAVTAAGGNDKAGNLTVSWSIGEVMTETFAAQSYKLTQGVQQPQKKAVQVISSLPEIAVGYQISAYPNPANDFVIVAITDDATHPLDLKIFDANGKLLYAAQTAGSETRIPVSDFTAGLYLLQITDKKNMVQTFKIIKH